MTQVKAPAAPARHAAPMDCCHATDPQAPCTIEIDGGVVTRALGIAADAFRRLLEEHRIAVRCECGTGEDAGVYRATFYYGPHYARLLVDGKGCLVAPVAADHEERAPA